MTVRILTGDCRSRLRELPDESVHCCVTSPPYWGLRDYQVSGQIGLEPSYQEYVATMVDVFREVRRVLRADGVLWLNLGDSYSSSPAGNKTPSGLSQARPKRLAAGLVNYNSTVRDFDGLKPKDLCGIPWRVAFALQADGWWLRQDIIWSKPNPMPESVTDRCTKAHEYVFMLSKSARYWYDAEAVREPINPNNIGQCSVVERKGGTAFDVNGKPQGKIRSYDEIKGANKHSVWEIATAPFPEAHFATFPPALIEPCILAGCPERCCWKCGAPWVREVEHHAGDTEAHQRPKQTAGMASGTSTLSLSGNGSKEWAARGGKRVTLGFSPSCSCNADAIPGTVLDPFFGAGTTGLVADRLGRHCIGIELNPQYIAMAESRIRNDAPLFAEVSA